MLVKSTGSGRKEKKKEKDEVKEEVEIFNESPFQQIFTEELMADNNSSEGKKLTVITD